MMKTAIVGCGFMGTTHTEALRRLGIPVVGLCGFDPEEGQRTALRLNLGKAYNHFEEVIADPEVNVVHLCTPNYLHYSMAKAALQAGKHVLCEKPVANTSAEAAEMVKMERDTNRVGAVNYNLRFYPLSQEARARIAAGDLGEVRIIHGEYCQDWLFLPSDWNWRLEPELGGDFTGRRRHRNPLDGCCYLADRTGNLLGLRRFRHLPAHALQASKGSGDLRRQTGR